MQGVDTFFSDRLRELPIAMAMLNYQSAWQQVQVPSGVIKRG